MKKRALVKIPSDRVFKTLLIMKLTIALLLFTTFQVAAKEGRTQETVNVNFNKTKLVKALKEIEKQSHYRFVYSNQVLSENVKITISATRIGVTDLLKKVLSGSNLTFEQLDDNLLAIKKETKISQAFPVKGKVTNSKGEPMVGVSVSAKSGQGTSTNDLGEYTLNVEDNDVLTFSYVGFVAQTANVNKQSVIDITLQESGSGDLDEVVVTALGVKRQEKSLGYATQRVSGKALATVKGVDMATSLSGRVSGLVVKNPTEFFATPTIELRGETALLVVDGVMGYPVGNIRFRDIPADIIESIDVLKGPTASALYGAQAAGGVILVTTTKGKSNRLAIDINSNTMIQTGFLAIPKIQTSYGHGTYGNIDDDYVWGPKLDVGTSANQWNPITKQMENMPLVSSGKNNLKNFIETGIITNNSITLSQAGQNSNFRATFNHMHNKGQFPNQSFNIYSASLAGEIKTGDKFTLESHMGFNKKTAPQTWGSGYGNQGYLYQLIMWTGPDYDIRQYKDYWVTPYQRQNWLYSNWYDNPYLIANEKLYGVEENVFNTSFTATYKFTNDLKLMIRPGFDFYSNTQTQQNPTAAIFSVRGGWNARGLYSIRKYSGWSTNNDAILSYSKKISDFTVEGLAGAAISYYNDESLTASTTNGLTAPTFYSINGSVEPPTVTPGGGSKQTNSIYGRVSLGWKNAVFLDGTGRNDWISTQPKSTRSYFYPSLGSSVILSEFIKMPQSVDMLKIRGSWALFKTPADVYATNRLYSVTNGAWVTSSTYNSASYPSNLLGSPDILPTSARTWEIGAAAYLFKKRLHADVTYFNKYYFNRQINQTIPSSSGFSSTIINTDETYVRRGWEITIDGTIIKNRNFEWNSTINWSNQHRYYKELDERYSAKSPWVAPGLRLDAYLDNYWVTNAEGEQINVNGYPEWSDYQKKYGFTDPDFSLGFINYFTIGKFLVGLNIDGRVGGLMYNYIYDKQWDAGTNPESDNQYRYDAAVNGLSNYIGHGVKVIDGAVTYDSYGNILTDTRKYAKNDVPINYQDYAQWFRGGDAGAQSKSFFKLRELSIGYRFPETAFGKSGIKNASVSLTAQNLFLWTNFTNGDPDVDAEDLNSPSQRMIGINFKIGF